jgi:hypothetical protein
MALPPEQQADIERFFTTIKRLKEFDKAEILGVVRTLIALNRRDLCFTGNYYRAAGNIETLLKLTSVRDFQAIAMICRALFEIAVDFKLIDQIPNSVEKILAFPDVEKLRSAKRIVEFKAKTPTAAVSENIYAEFITRNAARIEAEAKALWPDASLNVYHWSGKKFENRIALVGAPLDEIYAVNYPQLSWYGHAGFTGILNLEMEAFQRLAGVSFTVAIHSYMAILAAMIQEYKIDKANEKIEHLMKLARMLPFADGPMQEQALRQALS